jgi:type VI secretion system protein VasI
MIPIIGGMIGLYMITRMVELLSGGARPHIKVFAAITAIANVIGIIALMKSGSDLSSVFGGPSSTPSIVAPLSGLDTSFTSNASDEPSWDVRQTTNPIDDSPTVVLSISAASGKSRMGEAPTLILRCSQRETTAYIHWNDFLGSDGVSVTTRLGKKEAQTRTWQLSSDNTATFYPGNTVQFIKALVSADTLVAKTTPYNESPVTAVFAVTGLADKLTPLQTACGWK